jgi:ribosome-associated toxin RatA of RatAB toxin-antitoxin module
MSSGAARVEARPLMETCIELRVQASAGVVFDLAANVENWPRLLPHYRWVRVIAPVNVTERVVEMAAWRQVAGPLRIPLQWTSIQRLRPDAGVIEFQHVKGVSQGMQVEWRIEAAGDSCLVRLQHVFTPAWPIPEQVVQTVVGEYFVNGVAQRTLHRLAELAESCKIGL